MIFADDMLRKSAKDFPDKICIIHNRQQCTYQEINALSDRLMAFLVSKGVKKGDRIGIFSSKNVEEIVIIFAILKLGAILVHINPHFKEDQLRCIAADCDIRVLFIHPCKFRVFDGAFPQNLQFDLVVAISEYVPGKHPDMAIYSRILEQERTPDFSPDRSADDTAAIIYTSGSTGKPKGVIVTHRILFDATKISVQVLKNNQDDRLLSATPFSFDGALSQLFTMVYVAGTLVLQSSNFPKDIVKSLVELKITGLHGVPSYFRMLMMRHSPLTKYEYPHLRYVSVIGECFPQEELFKLGSIFCHSSIYIMYGTTEAFRSTLLDPDQLASKYPSIGKPLPGVEILVVDKNNNKCEPGVIGELVHKGAFVSPGYWNDAEKTEKTFRNNAVFTGDLGKYDENGYLYFSGRKDRLIKTQGYRVNPLEIEESLKQLQGVVEVAVFGVADTSLGIAIKAILKTESKSKLNEGEIKRYCRGVLPYYMVPEYVEFQSEFGKTATYKIDYSLLKQLS